MKVLPYVPYERLFFYHTVLPHKNSFLVLNLCLSFFPQHIVSVLSCSSGSTLPLHLAAYVHSCAPTIHAGYSLHSNPLYSRPPLQLSASTQRAAHRGGTTRVFFVCDIRIVVSLTLGFSSTEQ